MWYIIGAAEGAHLLAGLSKEITPEDYVKLVGEGRITEVLADHKVAPGDVFFLPAGRIHAICGGCYLAEIQETSDITYRIFDYNRPGLDGKPRQLHTQEAKDVIDYKVYPEYRTPYERKQDSGVEVAKCQYFTTDVYELSKPLTVNLEGLDAVPDNFYIVMALEGEGCIGTAPIKAGEAVLILGEKQIGFEPSAAGLKLLTTHL
jgi:mannose-6-phosphate isomerase